MLSTIRAFHVQQQLLRARNRGQNGVPQLVKSDVSVPLRETNSFAIALQDRFFSLYRFSEFAQ